jgi:hypothetical protein
MHFGLVLLQDVVLFITVDVIFRCGSGGLSG